MIILTHRIKDFYTIFFTKLEIFSETESNKYGKYTKMRKPSITTAGYYTGFNVYLTDFLQNSRHMPNLLNRELIQNTVTHVTALKSSENSHSC